MSKQEAIQPGATQPDTIRLTDDEIRQGMSLNMQSAKLEARQEVLKENMAAYQAHLRAKYGLNGEYQLEDYLTGFVRVKKE